MPGRAAASPSRSWPGAAANAPTTGSGGEQALDQCAGRVPRAGMDDETRRFVDHDEVVIDVHDLDLYLRVSGQHEGHSLRGLRKRHVRTLRDPLRSGLRQLAPDPDPALVDPPHGDRARHLGEQGDEPVEALAGQRRRHPRHVGVEFGWRDQPRTARWRGPTLVDQVDVVALVALIDLVAGDLRVTGACS